MAKAQPQTQLAQRNSRMCRSVIVMVLGLWLNTMIKSDFRNSLRGCRGPEDLMITWWGRHSSRSRKCGGAVYPQSLLLVSHFLQQSHTSITFPNSTADWGLSV